MGPDRSQPARGAGPSVLSAVVLSAVLGGPTAQADPGFDPAWLALREPADAAARAEELLGPLRGALAPGDPLVVHDLGSGTGSMARWLAPLLPGPQRWVLHDHDQDLLAEAARRCAGLRAADGSPVPVTTVAGDLTKLSADDLAGAGLITASALLDLLTGDELTGLAAACSGASCPALLTLSVAGVVQFEPADPRDARFAAAFNAHQRRAVAGRHLLGPDAPAAAAAAFADLGGFVRQSASPWRLGADHAALRACWVRGWVAAAVEQEPDLQRDAEAYLADRLRPGVSALVQHRDLLVLPAVPTVPVDEMGT